jgi:hypothetical protein
VPKKIIGPRNLEVRQNRENHNEELQSLYSSPDIRPTELRRAENIASTQHTCIHGTLEMNANFLPENIKESDQLVDLSAYLRIILNVA